MVHAVDNTELDPKLARQLAGQCCYGACDKPALAGSDYCDPHDAHEKGRDSAKKKRRRQRLADQGRCITGCGSKVGKRLKNGRAVQRRCRACGKSHKKAQRDRRGVPGDSRGVPVEPARGHVKLDTADRREGRNPVERYVGRARRGAPSKEDRIAEVFRDVGYARTELEKFERAYAIATSDEVQALPAVQREAAMALARDHAAFAARFLDDIVDRLK